MRLLCAYSNVQGPREQPMETTDLALWENRRQTETNENSWKQQSTSGEQEQLGDTGPGLA